jgi:hypothetical protein
MLKKYYIILKEETRIAQTQLTAFGLKKEGTFFVGKLNKESVDFISKLNYILHIEESLEENN